jgi:hypothetical protein
MERFCFPATLLLTPVIQESTSLPQQRAVSFNISYARLIRLATHILITTSCSVPRNFALTSVNNMKSVGRG